MEVRRAAAERPRTGSDARRSLAAIAATEVTRRAARVAEIRRGAKRREGM
jgi:hypothetical protein